MISAQRTALICAISALLFVTGCQDYHKISAERYHTAFTQKPYDAIIVPGLPYDPTQGWSPLLKERLLWAHYLYRKGFTKHLIFSGAAVYSRFREASVMAEFARGMGIPDSAIILEPNAEHSVENIYFSCLLAKEHGWDKIAVSTDVMQSLRFSKFKKETRLNFDIIPIIKDSVDWSVSPPVIDTARCVVKGFVPITQRKPGYVRFHNSGGKHLPREIYR